MTFKIFICGISELFEKIIFIDMFVYTFENIGILYLKNLNIMTF